MLVASTFMCDIRYHLTKFGMFFKQTFFSVPTDIYLLSLVYILHLVASNVRGRLKTKKELQILMKSLQIQMHLWWHVVTLEWKFQ